MKIYHLYKKPEPKGYDVYLQHIVIADSEEEALELCPDSTNCIVEEIGEANSKQEKGTIVSDFRNG